MPSLKFLVLLVFLTIVVENVSCNTLRPNPRLKRRIHLPFLGLGPYCSGCPSHFCDDDPAIIHGYCCGCASLFDALPVRCPPFLRCPLNGQQICDDYEYMMHCCCEAK